MESLVPIGGRPGAVAQKISSVETAEEFFKRRSQGAEQVDFMEILRNAPDRSPDPGDELPSAKIP